MSNPPIPRVAAPSAVAVASASAIAGRTVLIVDLNNFARYPTVAVGYLAAVLRRAGFEVRVLSPLAHGVPGVPRELPARPLSLLDQQLRFASALSGSTAVAAARRTMVRARQRWFARRQPRIVEQLRAELFSADLHRGRPDAVLISTYLMYYDLCCELGRLCEQAGVPLLIGGSYFFQPEVADAWRGVPGLTALACGEMERELPELVEGLIRGEDLRRFAGIRLAASGPGRDPQEKHAPPLRDLDALPFPDYSDFPWQAYPNAIVPLITGRGCAWGRCTFCSDVTSTAGRSFRSRSPENVLMEMKHQSQAHDSGLFVFTDLKLNSSLPMWHALLDNVQRYVPGARWIAAVHVGAGGGSAGEGAHVPRREQPHGLSREELRAARAAGVVRLTTGLESGSQRVLDLMQKGTDLAVTSRFLRDARDAGISIRTTMIVGYPGETAADVHASADFLNQHRDCIARVSLNRFALMTGTSIHRRMERQPLPGVTPLTIDHRMALIEHRTGTAREWSYRRAVARLVASVHAINRRPLQEDARDFDGVM
jgi:anaerobic magnesium-protoporphyrin IX monomethyl ester cyclase